MHMSSYMYIVWAYEFIRCHISHQSKGRVNTDVTSTQWAFVGGLLLENSTTTSMEYDNIEILDTTKSYLKKITV